MIGLRPKEFWLGGVEVGDRARSGSWLGSGWQLGLEERLRTCLHLPVEAVLETSVGAVRVPLVVDWGKDWEVVASALLLALPVSMVEAQAERLDFDLWVSRPWETQYSAG